MHLEIEKLIEELLEKGYLALKKCDTVDGTRNIEYFSLEKTTDPNDPQCPENIVYSLHSEQARAILYRYFNQVEISGLN